MKNDFENNIIQEVKSSYAQFAKEFDQSRKRQWPEFKDFLAYTKEESKVLDLGCGNGRLYDFLKQKKVQYLGVDHNPEFLKLAKKNFPKAQFELAEMTELNLKENNFDNVFCVASFHHIPSKKLRKKSIEQIHNILKKDGILILTTWNLIQKKYWKEILKSFFRSLLYFGKRGGWNDFWIQWGNHPIKRYYHSFLPYELKRLFNNKNWKIEAFYFTKKGKRVRWFQSFNFVLIVRKK